MIHVHRELAFDSKGRMIIDLPKTEASKAPVPIIPVLREILVELKTSATQPRQNAWMFPASFVRGGEHTKALKDALGQTPRHPTNFIRDQLSLLLQKAGIDWHGFHAFRRGLATNLHALGVQDLDIQQILRHSSVEVTRAAYIKKLAPTAQTTMNRFNVAWSEFVKQQEGQLANSEAN